MFWVFDRNANDMLFLYRVDNMLIIWVWMISITFKYVERRRWCLCDLRYDYENMIWVMFWWVLKYAGVEI